MRRWILVLPAVAAIGSCRAKHEASTGKEFFEKMRKAEKDQDAETLWKMMSKNTQEALVQRAKSELDDAKGSTEAKDNLKKLAGVEADPMAMDPLALAKAILKKRLELEAGRSEKIKLLEEKTEGDKIILVTQEEGQEREETVLIKEDGFLRADFQATAARQFK